METLRLRAAQAPATSSAAPAVVARLEEPAAWARAPLRRWVAGASAGTALPRLANVQMKESSNLVLNVWFSTFLKGLSYSRLSSDNYKVPAGLLQKVLVHLILNSCIISAISQSPVTLKKPRA